MSRAISILAIIFVLRPFMFWLMRRIPEGRPIKESHFFVMIVMFLTVSFAYECLGFSAPLGAMILVLCVPPGRPLGSGVVEKLEAFISAVLLPTYIVGAGRYVDIFQISMVHYIQAEILILLSFSAKLAAGVLSQEFYSVLTLMAVLTGAVTTPLIYYLYNPSKRYTNYKRRTIQQSRHENELRILLCLHEEDQVCSLMNVLKASYSTREKPIGAFVLDLIELVGQDRPLVINHQFHQRLSTTLTRTDRIINAFNQYELRSEKKRRKNF